MRVPGTYEAQAGGFRGPVGVKEVSGLDGIDARRASGVGRRVHFADLAVPSRQQAARLQGQAVQALGDYPVPQASGHDQHADEATLMAL